MDDEQTKRGGPSRLLWLFVIIAVAVAWWYFRDGSAAKVAQADDGATAAAIASTDTIVLDLKDDVTAAQRAAIERDLGITLTLADQSGEAAETQLYIAHVDPSREVAVLAALSQRSEVEIAEPDATVQLDQSEEADAAPIEAKHEGFPNDPLYNKQWNLRQIAMPAAWKLAQGNGVIVAVLDTGVAY